MNAILMGEYIEYVADHLMVELECDKVLHFYSVFKVLLN